MLFHARGSVLFALIALCVVSSSVTAGSPHRTNPQGSRLVEDRRSLVAGVREIVAPNSLPGVIATWGKDTFVILTGRENRTRLPMASAAYYGKGRVVALGHGGFFEAENQTKADNARFAQNVVQWLRGATPADRPTIVVDGSPDAYRPGNTPVEKITRETLARDTNILKRAAVLVLGQDSLTGPNSDRLIRAVQNYVKDGGGLLIAGPAWGWLQLNPGKDLTTDHTGNRLLYPMGLAFADGYFDRTSKEGWLADDVDLSLAHAENALTSLTRHADGKATLSADALGQVTQTLSTAMGALPVDDKGFGRRVTELVKTHGGDAIPTRENPVTVNTPFARLGAVLYSQQWKRLDVKKIVAYPSAASFPGAVAKDAPHITRSIPIVGGAARWVSTGLYAPPGSVVTITAPDKASQSCAVRIGSHTDTLWHLPQWERFPDISMRRPLSAETTRIASPFGGLIYVDVPEELSKATASSVTISGAVAAPYFIRGVTSLADWKATIRNTPGPWAELAGNNVILTVPSSVVRDLDDPEALMVYWDEVMDRCYELYAEPHRPRPERYCVDRQISAGYMHSGYPIMTGDDVAKTFVELAVLRSPTGKVWGFYHEMGHNFQEGEWTFDGTGEVTNNLFSLYGAEKINGITAGAHPNMASDKIKARFAAYLKNGAKYEEWKSDPFLALFMYVQVQKTFGWSPFTRVFAEYRALPRNQRPRTDDEKRDQWMVRLSRATGKNLAPFFQSWGVPTSEKARQSLSDLPTWMPEDIPASSSTP